jgi:hypothetical protein
MVLTGAFEEMEFVGGEVGMDVLMPGVPIGLRVVGAAVVPAVIVVVGASVKGIKSNEGFSGEDESADLLLALFVTTSDIAVPISTKMATTMNENTIQRKNEAMFLVRLLL